MYVFDAARKVSAADVARRAGMRLEKHGGREWGCCPFHIEKTASCLFDAAGRFHCFGCGADGDSIDFHSRLYGVDKLEAARALAGDTSLPHRVPLMRSIPKEQPFLSEEDDQGYSWGTLCTIRHAAQALMDSAKPDSDEFWEALAYRADADSRLDNLLAGEMEGVF